MRRITKPTDRAREVFEMCIASKIDPTIKARLLPLAPLIEEAEREYDYAATTSRLFTLRAAPNAAADEARNVYTQRFQPLGSLGRGVYDRMILSAPNRLCPLCGAGFVETLDHHLPKSPFWAMAVTPINLIPACEHCNHAKHSMAPASDEEQTIHPYYDNFDDEIWLAAFVAEVDPVAVTYDVIQPAGWDEVKNARARQHFRELELGDLYISRAGTELSENRRRFIELYDLGGGARVREHLQDELRLKASLPFRNDWKIALYRALASSDWFCDEGCLTIGKA